MSEKNIKCKSKTMTFRILRGSLKDCSLVLK